MPEPFGYWDGDGLGGHGRRVRVGAGSTWQPPLRVLRQAAVHGQLWGLRAAGGWVVAEDDEGDQYLPVWPHQRFAEALATASWEDEVPVAIDVDEWVEGWLPDLERDGLRVAVFQTPADEGVGVSPERLRRDLEIELEKVQM
jgi:Protein of unknown function (DUF2750)